MLLFLHNSAPTAEASLTLLAVPVKPLIPPTTDSAVDPASQLPDEPAWESETEKFLSSKPTERHISGSATAFSELSTNFRHSGWAPTRRKVEEAMLDMREVSDRRVSSFRYCGADAFVECRYSGYVHKTAEYRIRTTKCHDRFCIPCSRERSGRIRDSLLRHMHGRKDLSLITLTLRASEDKLTAVLDRLTKCFRALRGKALWKKNIEGGASIIESKIGQDGKSWHCHYHVVAEAKYINKFKLSDMWLKITGDSRIVDVKRVGSHGGAVSYITKYVTKAADSTIVNSPQHLREAIIGFTGRRLVATFGTWRGLKLMEKPDEEPLSITTTEWRSVGCLDEIIRRYQSGDADAGAIIRKLRRPQVEHNPDPGRPI